MGQSFSIKGIHKAHKAIDYRCEGREKVGGLKGDIGAIR
jgi:hypothetical protein